MKKFTVFILTFLFLLSVCACEKDENTNGTSREESAIYTSKEESVIYASEEESDVLVIDDTWRNKISDDFLINQLKEATDTELITVRVSFYENFTDKDIEAETSIDENWDVDRKNQAYRETRIRFVQENVNTILEKYKGVVEYELITESFMLFSCIDVKATKENVKAFGCMPEVSHMSSLDKKEPIFTDDETVDISESSDYSE